MYSKKSSRVGSVMGCSSSMDMAETGCLCNFCGLGLVAAAVRHVRLTFHIESSFVLSKSSPSAMYCQRVVANNRGETGNLS